MNNGSFNQDSELVTAIQNGGLAADRAIEVLYRRYRNEVLTKVKTDLSGDEKNQDVTITSAIYVLDEATNDVNIPMHVKTAIWDIISNLESMKNAGKVGNAIIEDRFLNLRISRDLSVKIAGIQEPCKIPLDAAPELGHRQDAVTWKLVSLSRSVVT